MQMCPKLIAINCCSLNNENQFILTQNGRGKFRMDPKIECLNFEPQYFLNYSRPTNYLKRVRKKSTNAFESVFELLGWGGGASPHLLRTFSQTGESENLRSIFFGPVFLISKTSSRSSVKRCAMLSNIV